MNVLAISSLFPNSEQPTRGVFVQQQLAELSRLCKLQVVAPVPWAFPLKKFKQWYSISRIPQQELIDGIETYHPRYLVIPKICRSLYGLFFFLGMYKTSKRIFKKNSVDIIIAYFAYPDGFASLLLAKLMKKPVVIYVLGSDINVFTKSKIRRLLTKFALTGASHVIAVSGDLKEKVARMGIPENKISVLLNGVDTTLFKPMDRDGCRRKLNLPTDKHIILFVGALRKIKGVEYLVEAFKKIEHYGNGNVLLILIGDGEQEKHIESKIHQLGIETKVMMISSQLHQDIPLWMNSCDVFCLPSLNEGCPNVILEALACNKRVVASRIGGIPELITSEERGSLVSTQDSQELAQELCKVLSRKEKSTLSPEQVIVLSWKDNAKKFYEKLMEIRKERIN